MRPIQLLVVVTIFVACGGDPGVASQGAPLAGGPRLLDDGPGSPQPIGSFETLRAAPGDVQRIVLMADRTAHAELAAACVNGSLRCAEPAVAVDSYYQVKGSDGVEHLELISQEGKVLYSADSRYDGTVLDLLRDGSEEWQSLTPSSIAWCAEASQCEQQWLPTPVCTGQWACVDGGCQYQCSRWGPWQAE